MAAARRFYEEAEGAYTAAWQDSRCRSNAVSDIEDCIRRAGRAAGPTTLTLARYLAGMVRMIRAIPGGAPVVSPGGRVLTAPYIDAVVLGTVNRPGNPRKAWAYLYLVGLDRFAGFYAVYAVDHGIALGLRRLAGRAVRISIVAGAVHAVYPLNKAYDIRSEVRVPQPPQGSPRPQLPCTPPELASKILRGAVVPDLVVEAPRVGAGGDLVPGAAHMLVMRRGAVSFERGGGDLNKVGVRIGGRGGPIVVLEEGFYVGGAGGCVAAVVHFGGGGGYILSSFDCGCASSATRPYVPEGIVGVYPARQVAQELEALLRRLGSSDRRRLAELFYPPPRALQGLGLGQGGWLFKLCGAAAANMADCVVEVYRRLGDAPVAAPSTGLAGRYPAEDLELWLEEYCCRGGQEALGVGACSRLSRSCLGSS